MTTAAALSRLDYKVLLLEQAHAIGGLTRSFSRNGFTWDVGLHYCGTLRHDQDAGRILDWVSDGSIEFRSIGDVYDVLHFPDGFDLNVASPMEAYKLTLKQRFPDNAAEIDAYFEALLAAQQTRRLIGARRSMPEPFRSLHQWWYKAKIQRWYGRTTDEVMTNIITDEKLAAILTAQWGDYGGNPAQASFAVHAIIMGHYLDGAAYPAGGAATIAKGLVPVIEASGGSARADMFVSEILIEDGSAVGVQTNSGEKFMAPVIVSAIGAAETVKHLLPQNLREQEWAKEIAAFKPSVCHFSVYLGFEGDIEQHGATRANHWFHDSWNTRNAIWSASESEPLSMGFVSFPSLKDVEHEPGPSNRHTGEILVLADWSSVAEFADGGAQQRPEEWAKFKQTVEDQMMKFFAEKFPELVPLVVYHELGTPLATAAYTGHEKGGIYGVETTPRRFLSKALNAATPVRGLFLSGQDVMTPGIAGAFWGGLFGAAAINPKVFRKFS